MLFLFTVMVWKLRKFKHLLIILFLFISLPVYASSNCVKDCNEKRSVCIESCGRETVVLLKSGWNLVGFSSDVSLPVMDVIKSIADKCEAVWGYVDNKWFAYFPAYPEYSDLNFMEPGRGYWIKVSVDCEWRY